MSEGSSAPASRDPSVTTSEFGGMQRVLGGRMPQLDALRAFAILAVILHNAGAKGLENPAGVLVKLVEFAATTGWVGVQLFFVLSGFLITGILVDGRGDSHQLRNFYMRRVLRIFPLYYAFLFVVFVLLPLLGMMPTWLEISYTHQFWYWTYLINWAEPFLGPVELGHIWSLAVEEQFYILWPMLVIAIRRRALAYVCLGLILSAIVTRILLIQHDPEFASKAAYMFTIARWDSLALGALLALALRDEVWYERLRVWVPRLALPLAAAVLLQTALVREFTAATGVFGFLNQTTSALLFGALIFASIVPDMPGTRMLQNGLLNPALRLIGKYSYAIYVVHIPMKYVWFSTLGLLPVRPDAWQQIGVIAYNFLGVSILSTAVAFVSWHVLERPFLNLKRYFINRAQPAHAASSHSGMQG
jgi:peptidoglycan/LPS O-acetylase OafA/YrhL